jgi:hypothetical protein
MSIDQLFQQAVALIGAGDVPALDRLLIRRPELARGVTHSLNSVFKRFLQPKRHAQARLEST